MKSTKIFKIDVPKEKRRALVDAVLATGNGDRRVELFGLPGYVFPPGACSKKVPSGRIVVRARMFEPGRAVEFDFRFRGARLEISNLSVWGYDRAEPVGDELVAQVEEILRSAGT